MYVLVDISNAFLTTSINAERCGGTCESVKYRHAVAGNREMVAKVLAKYKALSHSPVFSYFCSHRKYKVQLVIISGD